MADLGAVGRLLQSIDVLYGGSISGQVLDANLQPVSHVVRGIHRKTGVASGSAISESSDGSYVIYTNIQFGKTPHVVIEQTPDGSENARVFDNVIPL